MFFLSASMIVILVKHRRAREIRRAVALVGTGDSHSPRPLACCLALAVFAMKEIRTQLPRIKCCPNLLPSLF